MGMLLYMEELKRKEREAMAAGQTLAGPEKPAEPAPEPKTEVFTVTEKKPVNAVKKPVKRVVKKRVSK